MNNDHIFLKIYFIYYYATKIPVFCNIKVHSTVSDLSSNNCLYSFLNLFQFTVN